MRQLEVTPSTDSSTAMWKEKDSTTLKFLVKQYGSSRQRLRNYGSRYTRKYQYRRGKIQGFSGRH